MTVIIIYFISN